MMKPFAKHLVSLLALLLSTVMLLSACGGSEDPTTLDPAASDTASATADANSNADTSTTEPEEQADSSQSTQTNKVSSKKTESGQQTGKKTVWDANYLESMPDSVVSKGVHVLMWREYTPMEKKLVQDFEKKTGVKVRTTVTTEKEYSTKLIAMITAKNAPDVVSLSSRNFPSRVVKSLQPLDEKTFRLKDDCWKQSALEAYSINGKIYCVSMPGTWSCEDTAYVTYYMPEVLKASGISKTPWQHYQEGTWNWDTQFDMAMKVKNANPTYSPLSLQSRDLYMLSAGEDFVTYNGKQFTNNLENPSSLLTESWRVVCKLRENSLLTDWNLLDVQQGKCALFTGILYGMYKEGDWFSNKPELAKKFEAVPVAGPKGKTAYTPTRIKTWGVAKGAKNIEGAAYFLRYFLDTKNCDMDASFNTKQMKKVFDIITSSKAKQKNMYGDGVVDYTKDNTYLEMVQQLTKSTAANINTAMASSVGKVNAPLNRANKDLKRIK